MSDFRIATTTFTLKTVSNDSHIFITGSKKISNKNIWNAQTD